MSLSSAEIHRIAGRLTLFVLLALFFCTILLSANSSAADAAPSALQNAPEKALATDPDTGLVKDDGWLLVRGHCGACHSLTLVTQNQGDRAHWLGLIRWMQETQKLWPIDPVSEDKILTYLAKYFPAAESGRRPPLAKHLLPK